MVAATKGNYMSVHHHHVFQFDEQEEAVFFDGVLVHEHDPAEHRNGTAYARYHRPLGGYIDDANCMEDGACRWTFLLDVPVGGDS